jgi:hypothetical protein
MAMARLAEAADQDVVARLEEENLGRDAARLQGLHGLAVGERRVSAACIEHQREPAELVGLTRHQLGEVAQQLGGQVVDDAEADILEQLAGRGLARAGQAADDRDVWLVMVATNVAQCRYLPVLETARMVNSYSPYMTTPRTMSENASGGVSAVAATNTIRST